MAYLWIKAAHITADVAWMGGMVLLTLVLSIRVRAGAEASPITTRGIEAVLRWRYKPARSSGSPVRHLLPVVLTFR